MYIVFCNIIQKLKTDLFVYILVFSLIIISDDCYWFSTSGNHLLFNIKLIFTFFLPVLLYYKGARLSEKQFIFIFFAGLLLSLSSLISYSSLGGVSILLCIILSSLLLTRKYEFYFLSSIYSHVIMIIMIYSLVLWVLLSFSLIEPTMLENKAEAIIQSYGGCIFFEGSFGGVRNSAIFREPGMFMIFICLGYYFDVFIRQRILSKYQILLYFLSMASTFSTAGFIVFSILYVLSIFNKSFKGKRLILPLFLLLGAIIICFSSEVIYNNVFGKLNSSSSEVGSSLSRVSSIFVPLNIMFDNLFLGVGTGPFRDVYIDKAYSLYHTFLDPAGEGTNTFFNAGALFGVWLFFLIIFGFYKFSSKSSAKLVIKFGLFLCLLLIFSNESMVYSILPYILVFYGYDNKKILIN